MGEVTIKALNNTNFEIEKGELVVIVGPSGAGKTTITNLINRFYDITKGSITYDGIDVKLIKKDDLRKSISIVLQDTHLFTGTIADNIRYGKLDASDEEVIEAAKLANADSFIRRLPNGYQTMLSSDGTNLSQGQRQLLAIARAAICNPPVLILDEATSMLDPRGRKEINELVKELKKQNNMTIISITHDIEEAKNADRVILLNKGEIVDCDKPQKILTNEKLLKELKLDIPFSLKIARKLQKKGYQIKDTLDVEELEKQLCQLHAKV